MRAEITIRGEIVEITAPETWPLEDAVQTQAEVARLLEERGLSRILVDCRRYKTTQMNILDTYQLTSSHREVFPPGTRHATVVAPEDKTAAPVLFADDVAVNRGIDFRTFDDLESARAWLLGEPGR
jgi:hypothetical protein